MEVKVVAGLELEPAASGESPPGTEKRKLKGQSKNGPSSVGQNQEANSTTSTNIHTLPIIEKQLELEYDLGNLMASDSNEVSTMTYRSNPNQYVKKLTQDNVQLLINKIWTLPFERVDDVVIAKLPKPTYLLPREKAVPKPKPLSKWQTYAKVKGFTKRKKTRLVWDDIVNAYVPRFGYKRAAAEHEKDWVLEVPGNADPFEDQFEKKSEAKTERVAKNELQRLRNIARSRKVEVPSAGLIEKAKPSKTQLHQAMHVAKKATASVGKFQEKLPKEKPLKKTGVRRHFDPLVRNSGVEKSSNLQVLDEVMNKKPKLQLQKTFSRVVSSEANSEEGESRKGRKGGGKGKGKKGKGSFGDRDGGVGGGKPKNSKIKKGSARQGSFKKGRASPRSKPKRKSH